MIEFPTNYEFLRIYESMKKNYPFLIIIILSLLPIFSFFTTDALPHTHDGLVHVPRLAAFYRALEDGHFPPRYAGFLNHGYGLPLFNFIYHLPYYIGSLLLWLGTGLVLSFKVSLVFSYILAGIGMYGFARAFFKRNDVALLVTVFYQYAPFRLVELLIRGSYGEVYTYAFLPFALWGLVKFFEKPSLRTFAATAASTALLILSHNSVSLLFFGILVWFVIVFGFKDKKTGISALGSLFSGIMLSAYYWLPAVAERKFTYGDLHMRALYEDHFVPLYKLIVPNFSNAPAFRVEGISVQLGLLHLIGVFIGIGYLVMRKRKEDPNLPVKKLVVFSSVLLTGAAIMMSGVSEPLWKNIALLRQFQFPWRFLSLAAIASSFTAVFYTVLPVWKDRWFRALLLSLTILSTVYYWKPALGYDTIDEAYYWDFPLNTTYYGETDVKWSAGPASDYPPAPVEVIEGSAAITDYAKKSHEHRFAVEASGSAKLVDHTQYFPGWRVYIDGEKVPVEFQDPNWRGELTYSVPDGRHAVRAVFGRSKVRIVAEAMSVISLPGTVIGWFLIRRIISNNPMKHIANLKK